MGEDHAAITSTVALAGDASVVWRGYPGTGKTHGAEISESLVPDDIKCSVDMVSKLGIWSADMVKRINDARIVYFPEDQNAGDNDEVVKVKKKWGDGKAAERAKSENYGNDTGFTTLEPHVFLSTAALTNEAHEKSFDLESARRVVKINTDPSESATDAVLASKADALVYGEEGTRSMSPLDAARVRKHAGRVYLDHHDAVRRVRFFGAHSFREVIPMTFPEARSAFALFEKVLLGVARWYADDEVHVGKDVFLSPQRAAETWAFYGEVLVGNALKWDTSDREILSVFPQPAWNGEAPSPDSCLDMNSVMRQLKAFGLTDPSLVKKQIGRLEMKGFLAQATGFRNSRWHRTSMADVPNRVDWAGMISTCRQHAEEMLEGDALDAYLAKCEAARGPEAMQNPTTGEVGPIVGEASVLSFDARTGKYTPVGQAANAGQQKTGLFAFGGNKNGHE